jgi:hypothetical protein
MKRDDIIRMAREAGLLPNHEVYDDDLKRFAALVAAAEREACVRECEIVKKLCELLNFPTDYGHVAEACAINIMEMGQQ